MSDGGRRASCAALPHHQNKIACRLRPDLDETRRQSEAAARDIRKDASRATAGDGGA